MSENDKENARFVGMMLGGFFVDVIAFGLLILATKFISIWTSGISGRANLKEAEWERQVKIVKAKGIAEANMIIGDSLKKNEVYLRYLWIDSLQNTKDKIIYVPTNAPLPILESSRLKDK